MEYTYFEYDDESFYISCINSDEAIAHIYVNFNYIAKLYVENHYRHRGIGTQLIKLAEKIILSKGYKSIILDAFPDDGVSYEILDVFYQKLGYVLQYGRRYTKSL